jgi:16S rRNA processing protein RimM
VKAINSPENSNPKSAEEEALRFVVVGKVGKPYGILGFCKIHSFTDPPQNILQYPLWHLKLNHQWKPIELLQNKSLHDSLVVQFVDCHSPEAVKMYVNADIGVLRTSLPALPENQFYHDDLIGCRVIDQNGHEFGVVDSVLLIAEQDTLSIKGVREYLIPFCLGRYVLSVDLEHQLLVVDWDIDF